MFVGYAMVLGWGGIPVIWMDDELGLPNDTEWVQEAGHESDNRWIHRPRMPWAVAEQRGDGGTDAGRMFGALRRLIAARARLPHLHASVAAEVPEVADPGILPVLRRHPLGALLEVYNVTDGWRVWPA